MKNKNIVIITYNWPPRNAIGTHRPYAWAKAWSALGHQVTVLTAQKHAFDAPLDLDLPELTGVVVVEIPWGGVTTSLGSKLFLRSEWLRSIGRRMRLLITRYLSKTIEPREGWLASALPPAKKLAAETDIVVSTFGPAMSHQLGAAMKQANSGLFWVADYRDLWSQSHLNSLSPSQRKKIQEIERSTVVEHADMLTTVSEDMVKQLTILTGKKVVLLPNGFDIDEQSIISRLTTPKRTKPRGLRIVYTGMLYKGKRNPEPLLVALDELFREALIKQGDVHVDFYGARIDVARALADRQEFRQFINLIGHVPREQALKAQQDADLLLLLESAEPAARGVLTGKVFEYIAAGVPILSVGSPRDYEIPRLLARTGTGIAFEANDVEGIKKVILDSLETRDHPGFFKPDINSILQYSRKRQAIQFLDVINR